MKKFLSVLLALAVAFTFTFGSTMSAFAVGTETSKDDSKVILAEAYSAAVAALDTADPTTVNYDNLYQNQTDVNGNKVDDITSFTIAPKYIKEGMTYLYDQELAIIDAASSTPTSLLGVDLTTSKTANISLVQAQFAAQVESNATATDIVKKAAFDDYKAYLLALVEKTDLSVYTETKGVTYTALNNEEYDTSLAAATADVQYAKDCIANAKYSATGADAAASPVSEWGTTYENLYSKIFAGSILTTEAQYDNPLKDSLVTSLKYYAANSSYATKKSESADAATVEAARAAKLAALAEDIAKFENDPVYKAKYADLVAAYKEAKTYVINNTDTATAVNTIDVNVLYTNKSAVTLDENGNYIINGVDYIAYCAAAKAKVEKDATNKTNAQIAGKAWDDVAAAKALKAVLLDVYKTGTTDKDLYTGEATLTAGHKAAAKKDYSKVVADDSNIATTKAPVYAWGQYSYYEKEWEAVKAAVDAYNAAVDAANIESDIDDAAEAYAKAISKIAQASSVLAIFSGIDTSTINDYFKLSKKNAIAANDKVTDIYVTWDGVKYVSSLQDTADANIVGWYITKGARTVKEAAALYADACAVINAYKTNVDIKAEAEAANAKIAELPKTVTLADKAAVVAAYDAYAAVPNAAKKYITNVAALKKAVQTIEALEATAGLEADLKLPTPAKVTVADRDAIMAAKDAYKAYKDTTAYNDTDFVSTLHWVKDYTALTNALKQAEAKEIADLYAPLGVKYANDALTAEDAPAVKALQAKIAAYIDNWGEELAYEATVNAMDALVSKLVEAEYTDVNAKADLLDMSRKLTIWRTSKTSIKVTAVGSVKNIKDNGYTVQYKFYKKAPGAASYKLVKTTSSNKYTYTNLKKGTNKFQVKVVVKDADGKVVASKWTYYRAAKIK